MFKVNYKFTDYTRIKGKLFSNMHANNQGVKAKDKRNKFELEWMIDALKKRNNVSISLRDCNFFKQILK